MRYVFIFNPAAGKRNPAEDYLDTIKSDCGAQGLNFACYVTKAPGHATELCRKEALRGEPVRIYGFGGDGTLNELAMGVQGADHAEIGIFPCGSGNDYVRTFGESSSFLKLKNQLAGTSKRVDMIRSGERLSINLCSLGLDAAVAYHMVKFKKLPLVSGSMAYDLSLIKCLLSKLGCEMEIVIDGQKRIDGNFLFALAGSGQYYGGGYRGAPKAVPDDGLLDFVLIRKMGRLRLARQLGEYKAGGHPESPHFSDLLIYERGKKLELTAKKPAVANFDGECQFVQQVSFEVVPHAVRFIVPKK